MDQQAEVKRAVAAITAAVEALKSGPRADINLLVATKDIAFAVANELGMARDTYVYPDSKSAIDAAGRTFGALYVRVTADQRAATPEELVEEEARQARMRERVEAVLKAEQAA